MSVRKGIGSEKIEVGTASRVKFSHEVLSRGCHLHALQWPPGGRNNRIVGRKFVNTLTSVEQQGARGRGPAIEGREPGWGNVLGGEGVVTSRSSYVTRSLWRPRRLHGDGSDVSRRHGEFIVGRGPPPDHSLGDSRYIHSARARLRHDKQTSEQEGLVGESNCVRDQVKKYVVFKKIVIREDENTRPVYNSEHVLNYAPGVPNSSAAFHQFMESKSVIPLFHFRYSWTFCVLRGGAGRGAVGAAAEEGVVYYGLWARAQSDLLDHATASDQDLAVAMPSGSAVERNGLDRI
ncbi:hypothetical protein J6590_075093 [Homalodisca vitripennis]|nr:hypothetical protein J6590_075093 [Homalodisca vitripennis]